MLSSASLVATVVLTSFACDVAVESFLSGASAILRELSEIDQALFREQKYVQGKATNYSSCCATTTTAAAAGAAAAAAADLTSS